MSENKRYFTVMYVAKSDKGHVTGNMDFIVYGDSYINRDETARIIQERNPDYTGIVTTNIIELNEKDYESWTQNKD